MSKNWTKLLALMTVFFMLFSANIFAGNPGQSSGGKSGKKKCGFFKKVGAAIKKVTQKTAKAIKTGVKKTGQAIKTVAKKTGKAIKTAVVKTGKAIKTAGAKINNAVKDSGVWAKYKLLGCKNRVWVVGHYDKNGKWTKGHWRKHEQQKPSQGGNTPDQGGNNPNQGNNNPGQTEDPLPPVDNGDQASGGDNGQTPAPAPEPVPAPADPVLPELPEGDTTGNSGDSSEASPDAPAPVPAPEEPAPAPEEPAPAPEEPAPAPEVPTTPETPEGEQPGNTDDAGQAGQGSQGGDSEQSGQTSQQSGDAAQGAKHSEDELISVRTMGMLMNDLVKQSEEITGFKRDATPGMSFSMDVQNDVNSDYELREKNAKLLVKVIVWDLQKNDGKPVEYFKFFTYKMKSFDPESRKLIQDVLHRVKDGVQHGVGHQTSKEKKAVFEKRLSEIDGF